MVTFLLPRTTAFFKFNMAKSFNQRISRVFPWEKTNIDSKKGGNGVDFFFSRLGCLGVFGGEKFLRSNCLLGLIVGGVAVFFFAKGKDQENRLLQGVERYV